MRYFILLGFLACAFSSGAVVRADQLHLKDGRVIEADDVWEMNGELWFRQGKLISSVAKDNIARVIKPALDALQPAASSRSNAKAKEVVPSTVTPIILKEGGKIDADTAWEEQGLVGYLIGNMQAFVESSAVERVLRGVA